MFALLGADTGLDSSSAEKLISNYLTYHFGLRDKQSYLDLYGELCDFYGSVDVDREQIVGKVAANLERNIKAGELMLILLRLMEFCKLVSGSFNPQNSYFRLVAKNFGVTDNLYGVFCDFIESRETDLVRTQSFDGYQGEFKTLWIASSNTLVFSYDGPDEALLNDVLLLRGVFQVWDKSGVVKNYKGAPLYYSAAFRVYEESNSDSLLFQARGLEFRFPGSNNGLHNFTSVLRNGELVAVMGGSGAGKTTLLSILNGSLKPQHGSITINGHSVDDSAVKGLMGFVPQDDLLIEELTVYQNLYFTARLCFDKMPDEEIERRVMKVLSDLGLEAARDLVVGSPLNKTISGGQRKRLNIALELIREPLVIFLDEPTSGLSSADTENVMGLLKEQTYRGKLVVANIHQPSSDVYKLFDRLLLLDTGGYPIFDGNPIDAVTYFKTAANYADSQVSTCQACGNVNPETVLNIVNEKSLDGTGKVSQKRKVSPQQWHEMYLSHRSEPEQESVCDIPASSQKRPSVFSQMLIFLERTFKSKLANRQYVLITLLEAPVLAVICSMLTRYAPATGYTVMDNKNFVSFIFMAVIVAVFIGMSGSAEEIIRDRLLLKREKFLNLNYSSYIFSKIIFAAGVSLLQTALFVLVGTTLMDLHGMFLLWWCILFVSALLSSLVGLLLSQCLGSVVAIYISIPLLLIPQILLCGLVVPFSDLNGRSTTDNVPVIGDVIPSRWASEALAVGTYCYNEYEKPCFELDRERYSALFYREAYSDELEYRLEAIENNIVVEGEDHMKILFNSLPVLAEAAGIEPYEGGYDYDAIQLYMEKAKDALNAVSNRATLERDRIINAGIKSMGIERMQTMMKQNCNIRLSEFLTGSDSENAIEIVENRIVPKAARVFLTPPSRNGRAPFYSSCKVVGHAKIPTVPFNMGVMMLVCILLTIVLLIDIPSKIK
ncbi:MAG: ATP-binding cassette domain-containing protein [Bacteroidales bacterium]|nr:ATP-binding cassette domain-containing protein [Candidatus Equibacterium intestinale]